MSVISETIPEIQARLHAIAGGEVAPDMYVTAATDMDMFVLVVPLERLSVLRRVQFRNPIGESQLQLGTNEKMMVVPDSLSSLRMRVIKPRTADVEGLARARGAKNCAVDFGPVFFLGQLSRNANIYLVGLHEWLHEDGARASRLWGHIHTLVSYVIKAGDFGGFMEPNGEGSGGRAWRDDTWATMNADRQSPFVSTGPMQARVDMLSTAAAVQQHLDISDGDIAEFMTVWPKGVTLYIRHFINKVPSSPSVKRVDDELGEPVQAPWAVQSHERPTETPVDEAPYAAIMATIRAAYDTGNLMCNVFVMCILQGCAIPY
jgi:hypothetical protein